MHDINENSRISFVYWESGTLKFILLLAMVIDKEFALTNSSFITYWDIDWCNGPAIYSCSI